MSNKITNKKSKIFKIKIFYFTLGILVCSLVGVSAATYFESNAVTYDNTESGLNSTDVQGAIDELYNACKTPVTGGNGILEKVDIVTSGDGLYEDEYEEGRYFYKGRNPSNYVTFNSEFAGWRIISIEPEKTIKIIRTEIIGEQEWDSSYDNNWARPATLNTYLNETYYNGLNSTAKNQIVSKYWSIGAVINNYNNNDLATQIKNENSKKWYGNIALPTVSEYIRTNSNKSSCGALSLNNNNYSSCRYTSWMNIYDEYWTLSSLNDSLYYVNTTDSGYIGSRGVADHNHISGTYAVKPTLYLSSEVQITGGNGSQNDPYTIK